MKENIELYYDDKHEHAAVLISPGYGVGWSTWEGDALAYDKRVVEFYLQHAANSAWMNTVDDFHTPSPANQEACDFFKSLGYDRIYLGGFADIVLEWVKLGIPFKIREYDGGEWIEFYDPKNWEILE